MSVILTLATLSQIMTPVPLAANPVAKVAPPALVSQQDANNQSYQVRLITYKSRNTPPALS
uniref:hypothetical protein n=1 Tax=Brasilonema sp. UFV-L1 TaxID=2234130 RepID=UPI00145EA976